MDETGCITPGGIHWSNDTWSRLFFPESRDGQAPSTRKEEDESSRCLGWEELTSLDVKSLRSMEEQLWYARMTLTFGWSAAIARLYILGAEWYW